MIIISDKQLKAIMPLSGTRATQYAPLLTTWMNFYEINTPRRIRYFLAQIAHESAQLRYTEELASGAAYDTGAKAIALGNTPEKDGDGQKYKGRGLIQITGLSNYKAISKAFNVDFVSNPKLLATPEYAVRSACWWWKAHGLNQLADKDEFTKVTRIINGGLNGRAEREKFLYLANRVRF